MQLSILDISILIGFFVVSLLIGWWASKTSGDNKESFFLSGRNMPWWLLGVSMVATTFSADTPNLVTEIVRKDGVSGNWQWWAFLLTGMLTVFVYAKLWRRSGVATDLEFYELRYSGKAASFLRGFRAIYLGVFFNVLIMANVLLAGIKISGVLLGTSPIVTVLLVGTITVVYSAMGGLKAVIWTDFFQFSFAMVGMVLACLYVLDMPQVGGLSNLLSQEVVQEKMDFFPDFSNPEAYIPLLVIPLAVQWWSVWYPGAEPGGGGYIAQRMLSAKDEKNAVTATLIFNIMHYALRPWPWILIALASLVVFPDLSQIAEKFPNMQPSFINHDLAFPAMLSFLPSGLLGLVIAALMAALMSTISTHLNWGSSYLVNDVYLRYISPEASDKKQVFVGRIVTVVLMLLAAAGSLKLDTAHASFRILLQMGAGTGLLFILRWFWWRINAYSEISAMSFSLALAYYFEVGYEGGLSGSEKLLLTVFLTTIVWVVVTLLTKPTDRDTLVRFYTLIRPSGPGWGPVVQWKGATEGQLAGSTLGADISKMFLGVALVYAALFAIGSALYSWWMAFGLWMLLGLGSIYLLRRFWDKE